MGIRREPEEIRETDGVAESSVRPNPGLGAVSCREVADIRRTPNTVDGRQVRSTRHVVIVPTAGTGTHFVDGKAYDVEPGSVIHVLPGQAQRWDVEASFDGWVLVIETFVASPELFDLVSPASPLVQLGPAIDVAHSLVSSLTRPDILPPKAQERLRVSIASVLLELIAGASDEPEVPNGFVAEAVLVSDFRRELEFHYFETRSVADYAALIGCSAKTLTRATKRMLGQTPKQIIDARVTYAATRLLANTDISVNWISQKLGFSQQSNFAKFFMRQVDLTPAAYRESCKSYERAVTEVR